MKGMGQNRLELALLGLIAVVCAGLSLLQYRWTGDVSRAERSRLRSGLNEQVTRLTRAFDEEIRENCRALLPDSKEIRAAGIQEAHRIRYQQWTSSHERGLFTRIGIAVPEHGAVGFYVLDSAGRVIPMEWPSSWQVLQSEIKARVQGTGRPPSIPLDSTLLEFPVFEDSDRREGSMQEAEWMIFEVNEDYLRSQTLPHLVAEYLNAGGDAIYDLR